MISIQRVEAVVNSAAGAVGPAAAPALEALLSAFGLGGRVTAPAPADLRTAVREAVEAAPDLVIVLAGDGTANLAASLAGPDGPLIAPLPGGTMNFLPRALYGSLSWQEALRAALSRPDERRVSGGELDGRQFYCAAIVGAPALWALSREAVRTGKLARAWKRAVVAFRRTFMAHVRFQPAGGRAHRAIALSLLCPLISRALQEETALEAALLDLHDAAEVIRLGLSNMLGDWRRDPAVTTFACVGGRVWARRPMPALFDGEMHMVRSPSNVRFLPTAFRALVAKDEPGEPDSTAGRP